MAHLKYREPYFFRGHTHAGDTGPRFERLSKADWADVFCDIYLEFLGGQEPAAEAILDDAERRLKILRHNGLR